MEESPYVILTPVFVDYFNYLILLEKNFYPDTFKKQQQQKQSEQSSSLNGGSGDGHLNGHKEHGSLLSSSFAKSQENNDIFKCKNAQKNFLIYTLKLLLMVDMIIILKKDFFSTQKAQSSRY